MTRNGLGARMAGPGAILATLAVLTGCRREAEVHTPAPRPVEAVMLEVSDPSVELRIPGVVRSWAEEDVAFEVAGHVAFVTREGARVSGRWTEGNEVLIEGDLLARLDPSDFQAAVNAAEADLEAARIERDRVATANLAEARALAAEARLNLTRLQTVYDKGAASEVELTGAQTTVEVAVARVGVAEAGISAAEAAVLRTEAKLAQARMDLSRTELPAPFTGEVAETYVTAGAFCRPGTPVLRLTMVDPIEITVQVSAETSRRIARNDIVRVYVEGFDGPLTGKIQRSSTTADPGTRTFTVTSLARNRRVAVGSRRTSGPAPGAVPIADITIPMVEHDGQPGPLFVDEQRVLRRDDAGWYVWAIDGWTIDQTTETRPEALILRRIAVTPGDGRLNYQGIYVLRQIADPGTLEPGQVLATDVPPDTPDGATCVLLERRWALRPGDVVQVDFGAAPAGTGFYVPQDAVVVTGEADGHVFLLTDDSTVRAVAVGLGPVVNGLQRVDSPEIEAAPAGTRVITRGASSLADGDAVSVISEER